MDKEAEEEEEESFARSLRVRIKLSGPEVDIYLLSIGRA